ncbi:MAG: DUF1844 domain-containing protein [Candidatus Acidiferrales bacterium]
MADQKKEETFRVIDRRHFTEAGELRKDVVEQDKRDEEAASKKASLQSQANAQAAARPATKDSAKHTGGTSTIIGATDAAAAAPAPAAEEPAELNEASRSFQMLVDFLTRNAAAMLGGMADPRTGQPFVDLEGAREVIDMLDALREKTKGNLAKADEDVLLEVLGSLKLTFMEISKAAAEAMSKKAKGK